MREVAARSHRSFDDVLADQIRCAGSEPVLELLPDEELLGVCDSQPDAQEQEMLSELLDRNAEGTLAVAERNQLEELMRRYRRGLIRKAQALKVAVSRGIRPRLN